MTSHFDIASEFNRVAALVKEAQSQLDCARASNACDSGLVQATLAPLARELKNKLESKEEVQFKLGVLLVFFAHRCFPEELGQACHIIRSEGSKSTFATRHVSPSARQLIESYKPKSNEAVSWLVTGKPSQATLCPDGSIFGAILLERLTQPVTEELLNKIPAKDACIYFACNFAAQPASDIKDTFDSDSDEAIMRNTDLDDLL